MLVGAYPFEDQEDPKNFRKTISVRHLDINLSSIHESICFTFFFTSFSIFPQRIMAVQYKIPDYVHISQDCRNLLSRIFVANPSRVCMIISTLLENLNLFIL